MVPLLRVSSWTSSRRWAPRARVQLLLVAVGVAGPRDEGKRALDDCGWPASVRREGRSEGGSRRYAESVGKKRDEGGTKKEAHVWEEGGDVGKRGIGGGLTFGRAENFGRREIETGPRNRTRRRQEAGAGLAERTTRTEERNGRRARDERCRLK